MSQRSLQALCLMSFFLADVRDGLGPFLGIFLTERHWSPDEIGLVMTSGGIAGLLSTLPAGVVADATRYKRLVILVGCIVITVATLLLWYSDQSWTAIISQIVAGIAAAFIGPTVAGITLGLTGQKGFNHQMGRNEAYNHAGNTLAAVLAGFAAWKWGLGAVFILMMIMAVFAAIATMAIRGQDINHEVARGLEDNQSHKPTLSLWILARKPALLITGLTLLLFHLANAALLPMLSMRVASSTGPHAVDPGLYAAATVVISQLVMIPVAIYVSRRVDKIGYRHLIMTALLMMPLRALIAAEFPETLFVIPVQILDGIAAGILGVAVPGYIVSLLRGSGHVNAGQSVVMLMQGVGASMSPAMTGLIVARYSYSIAFSALGCIALVALLLWWSSGRTPAAEPA
ncbi:MFS transporter (plasmid) [Pantoea allii]|uniref:MFS transporter n=1 Tax=Pantoea allii TaxID=574096 RepID=A0ABS6VEV1_9GAMM|nr:MULTISPECIES: MFS transporter [Pantoea]MBW1214554.1 MFS transporter [Pantoea allii]MBW1257846.1 MFS transporter [Pantoea allii]MBW1266962.1 MFS transporter [Pantoea allii]MBW1289077.1 MFS transporter [Pantoea allii]MDJ0090088.1 MFS transporter [Pantoea allii]